MRCCEEGHLYSLTLEHGPNNKQNQTNGLFAFHFLFIHLISFNYSTVYGMQQLIFVSNLSQNKQNFTSTRISSVHVFLLLNIITILGQQ